MRLIYFRAWAMPRFEIDTDPDALARLMRACGCEGSPRRSARCSPRRRRKPAAQGQHPRLRRRRREEDVDRLSRAPANSASSVSLVRVPGGPRRKAAARDLARSRADQGRLLPVRPGSARQLRDLLTAVAGTPPAVARRCWRSAVRAKAGGARLLLAQLSSGAAGA